MTDAAGSDALMRAAFDSLVAPCAVLRPVRDTDGTVTDFVIADANRAACDYVDLPYERFVGERMSSLRNGSVGEEVFEIYRRAVEDGTPIDEADFTFGTGGRNLPYNLFDLHAVLHGDDLVVSWQDSTERHRQAAALAESERRRLVMAQHISDIIYETDDDGRITWVSPSIERVLGLSASVWLGRRPREIVVPDDVARVLALRKRVFGEGAEDDVVECRYVAANGETRWMAMRGQAIRTAEGVVGAVIVLRDIQHEVLLRRAVTTLSSANAMLVRVHEEDELLRSMCDIAVDAAGYLFAWYGRPVTDEQKSVRAVAASAEHRGYLDEVEISWGDGPLGQGPTGVSLRTGTMQIVADFAGELKFRPWLASATARGFRSSVSLPVFVDGALDGAFMVYAAEPFAFDAHGIAVMQDLAAQLGYGIARLRDAERLARSLDERRLLATAIDQAAEAIVVTDVDGAIRYANPATLKSTGYELGEVLGRNPSMFQSGLHEERFYEDMWRRLLGGQAWHGVLMNRRKTGEFYEEEATIAPVHDASGKRVAYVAVKHDLSRERSLEAAVTRDQLDRESVVSIMREVRPGDSLEVTAASLCGAVRRFDDIAGVMVIVLEADGHPFPVAIDGAAIPGQHVVGQPLQMERLDLMVEVSKSGPWWMDLRDRDGLAGVDPEFTQSMLDAGFTATAYAPIRHEGETVGVLAVVTRSVTADEWMPLRLGLLNEVGSFAGMLLGPQVVQHGRRKEIRAEIDDIIRNERFRVVFEPVVHLPSGAPVGYEALTRFTDGSRPDVRFEAAHAVGLGSELEAACARVALRDAQSLPAHVWLSVNFSPTSIVEGVAAEVLRDVDRSIILEITEHNEIENYAAVRRAIKECGEVLVAVDDAGAGFASLRHILELQPDIIKLDLALVRDIDVDPARQALAAGLRHFAALTGTSLIAEGVETEAEAAAIRQLGVELAQGFLFQPAPLVG
jgi:PAS domain S-box-containing protein